MRVGALQPTLSRRLVTAEWLFLLAGVLHLAAVPGHAAVWVGYAAFFVVVAVLQGGYSLLLPRLADRRWFLVAGLIGTAALLALWVQSRLWHTPVGPHRLHAEPFGLLDVAVAIVEVVSLWCLADAYPRPASRGGRRCLTTESLWT